MGLKSGNIQPQLDLSEHISPTTTGDNISAKRVVSYGWDGSNWQRSSSSAGKLVSEKFDYVARVLTNSTTETYTYKSGGSGGTTVATVTVVYTDSTLETISSVTRT